MLKRSIILLAVCLCIYESDFPEAGQYNNTLSTSNTNTTFANSEAQKYSENSEKITELISDEISNKYLISGAGSKFVEKFMLTTFGIFEGGMSLLVGSVVFGPAIYGLFGATNTLIRHYFFHRENVDATTNNLEKVKADINKHFTSTNGLGESYFKEQILPNMGDKKYSKLVSECSKSSPNIDTIKGLIGNDKQSYAIASTILYANLQNEYDRYKNLVNRGSVSMAFSAFITTVITDIKVSSTLKRIKRLNSALDNLNASY